MTTATNPPTASPITVTKAPAEFTAPATGVERSVIMMTCWVNGVKGETLWSSFSVAREHALDYARYWIASESTASIGPAEVTLTLGFHYEGIPKTEHYTDTSIGAEVTLDERFVADGPRGFDDD